VDALFVHGALSYLAVAVLKLLLVTGLRIWRPAKTTALGEQVVAETKGTAIAAVTYGDQIHNNIVVHVAIGVALPKKASTLVAVRRAGTRLLLARSLSALPFQ
jgi:hypothetical protein